MTYFNPPLESAALQALVKIHNAFYLLLLPIHFDGVIQDEIILAIKLTKQIFLQLNCLAAILSSTHLLFNKYVLKGKQSWYQTEYPEDCKFSSKQRKLIRAQDG